MVEHSVDTADANPVRVAPRRSPYRGRSRIYKREGLTQGTNLLGRCVQSTLGVWGHTPQENFEK